MGPLIPLAAGLVSQGAGMFAQGKANKKTREWNEHMYERQRGDSLADWAMQNEYNSPAAQMKRLREANLNPHLVYGGGAVAGPASTPRSSSPGSFTHQPFTPDLQPLAMGFMDWKMKEAQLDNVAAMTAAKEQEALLKSSQVVATNTATAGTKITNEQKQFNLDLANDLRNTSVEAAKASLQKTLANTQFTLDENERQAAMQQPNLLLAAEKVLTMRLDRAQTSWQISELKERIENLKKDGQLKQLDINLKPTGVHPGDALWQRVLAQLISGTTRLGKKVEIDPKTGTPHKEVMQELSNTFGL